MKIAVHMSMFCKTWQDDVSQYFPKLKQAGFDGVEISLFGAEENKLKQVFKSAQSEGLEIICGTGIGVQTDISSEDMSVHQNGIDYLKSAVDLAQFAGAKNINGVLYAPWQAFAIGENRNERWQRSAKALQVVSDYAKTANISLNCEVLNRFESDFINTLDEASEFLKLIDKDNVKILADTFHMNIEENSIPKALEENITNIGCIHVCENHRGVPGTGQINWEQITKKLKEIGYDGYLDMECFVNAGTQVGDALFMWRNLAQSPLDEAVKGMNYLRNLL